MNNREVIIKIVSKKLIPLILLFALYVQFHGDFGPGEGFKLVQFSLLVLFYIHWFLDSTSWYLQFHPEYLN